MSLSPPQQQIVELVQQGVTTVPDLAKALVKSERVVRAQITRIISAGQGNLVSKVQPYGPHPSQSDGPRTSSGPRATSSSNKQVLQEAVDAGDAVYELPPELIDEARNYVGDSDAHPMVLMGCCVQFVKLVGGRMAAHMLIEEVYEAIRAMVSDGSPKVGQEDWSAPWPLNNVELENTDLKARIADLERELGNTSEEPQVNITP